MKNTLNKEFYGGLLRVAIPVVIQQLIIVTNNLTDTIMVGKVSEYALAAVGAANQLFFVIIDCMFGFLSGCAVWAVQYWGIRDLKALKKILGIAYSMILVVTVVSTIVVYFFAPQLISIFVDEPEVVMMGAEYLRIVCFSYILCGITFTISYYSRAIMMLKWPTIFNAISIAINIFLNFCLIFGKLGFPELGTKGAAIATLSARIIEFICVVIYVYTRKDHPLKAKFIELKYDLKLYKDVMKTALPVAFNEFLWVVSFTAIFAIYGKISAVAYAVTQVAIVVTDIFQCTFFGLGNGANVMIGQALGQGKRKEAVTYSRKVMTVSWIFIAVMTGLLILLKNPIAEIYNFEPDTIKLLKDTLVIFAITLAPKMMSFLTICGILRAGGDTKFCLIVDSGANWFIQVPLALISVLVFKWSLPNCVLLVAIGDIFKMTFSIIRVYSNKWINVFTGK